MGVGTPQMGCEWGVGCCANASTGSRGNDPSAGSPTEQFFLIAVTHPQRHIHALLAGLSAARSSSGGSSSATPVSRGTDCLLSPRDAPAPARGGVAGCVRGPSPLQSVDLLPVGRAAWLRIAHFRGRKQRQLQLGRYGCSRSVIPHSGCYHPAGRYPACCIVLTTTAVRWGFRGFPTI